MQDFRNLLLPSDVQYAQLFTQHVFAVNYFKFDLYHGSVILLNSSLTKADKALTMNTHQQDSYTELSAMLSSAYLRWNSNLSWEQRLPVIQHKFSISGNFIQVQNYNFIDDIPNKTKSLLYSLRGSLFSNFSNEYINYELGVVFSKEINSYSLYGNKQRINRISPLLNLHGKILPQLRYLLSNTYESFTTTSSNRKYNNLSCQFSYTREASKFSFWVNAVNLLNLENPELKALSSTNNMFATEIITRMPGYIGIGIGYAL